MELAVVDITIPVDGRVDCRDTVVAHFKGHSSSADARDVKADAPKAAGPAGAGPLVQDIHGVPRTRLQPELDSEVIGAEVPLGRSKVHFRIRAVETKRLPGFTRRKGRPAQERPVVGPKLV